MIESLSKDKQESLYHTALILTERLKIGTPSADKRTRALLEQKGSFEAIFKGELFADKLSRVPGIHGIIRKLEKEAEFETLTVTGPDYPLKNVPDSTPVLYIRGDRELFKTKTIAVVGTRKPEETDLDDGEQVLRRLLEKEYTIVSGLAAGCDTLAHKYAAEHSGKTIAVLGTPLDRYSRKENRELQDRIAKEHLLVSQYPIGITTFPPHFAHRNHTTVSLSKEVVVIRAGDQSGTKHAIKHCIAQEKKLWVLFNNIMQEYEWTEKYKGKFKVPNAPIN